LTTTTRTIRVDHLARVEGEGALTIRLEGDVVVGAELRIFEPPRFFEAFLRGRAAHEAPDLTARICGICPVAYQMSACHAVEAAAGVRVDGPLRALRRLLYCGEWIESHVLHMVMLHAPDFLGVDDVVAMARREPQRVKDALRIKKCGNAILERVGGRAIHPVAVRLGGFHRVPTRAELDVLRPELAACLELAEELVRWCATFSFPSLDRDVELVALRHGGEYPFNEGRLVSTAGLDIAAEQFEEAVVEDQVPRSTALHARLVGRGPYVTGPLARFALNHDLLGPRAIAAARDADLDPTCRNPFRTLLVRGVEVVHALEEALQIVDGWAPPAEPAIPIPSRASRGAAITEAPRGILYHRYDIGEDGLIAEAKIVPPTSQNQRSIELDLQALGGDLARLPLPEATRRAEHAIRNYDPCISCSTHFLTLRVERS
jgi:sulfhydrogenase subunit alpha